MQYNENILITGGAGYIGSHTAKLLFSKGYNVIVLDNLCRGHIELVKWGEFINGDLENINLIKNVLCENQIKAVIHFAAFAYIGESVEKPGMYYQNNLSNTINLLNAMVDVKVNKIVFSSTCAVYGMPTKLPIPENHVQSPINPYGNSKLMIERALKDFDMAYDIKSISLRYFNAAGADLDGEIGELHNPETHLIPNALRVALEMEEYFKVFGIDYDTKDGTCIRDYIHVNDLAVAHLKSLESLLDNKESNFYNLGTGKGYSVKDILMTVEKVTGKYVKHVGINRRAGDPPVLIADYSKAKNELDWIPQHSDLETIIESAWNWHKNVQNQPCNIFKPRSIDKFANDSEGRSHII